MFIKRLLFSLFITVGFVTDVYATCVATSASLWGSCSEVSSGMVINLSSGSSSPMCCEACDSAISTPESFQSPYNLTHFFFIWDMGTPANNCYYKECVANASGDPCACDPGFYRTSGGVYSPTDDTCTVCSAAETPEVTSCTCAGDDAEPVCSYIVNLDWNDGSGSPSQVNCPIGSVCNIFPTSGTPPSGVGTYTFNGWSQNEDGTGVDYVNGSTIFAAGLTSPITIHARWKKTITFNSNYYTMPTTADVDCYHNGTLTVPALPSTPDNFSSPGDELWYSNNDGTGTSHSALATPMCDAVLFTPFYPKWEYTVDYNSNDATSGTAPLDTTCTRNKACSLTAIPAMTKTGYTLDTNNWYSNSTGTGGTDYPDTGTINNPAGNITLWAKWTPAVYEIKLYSNNVPGSTPSVSYYERYGVGWEYPLGDVFNYLVEPAFVPLSTGTFNGYWTAISGGIQKIPPSGMLPSPNTFTNATNLWARWNCLPGYWSNTGVCELCPVGYYCDGTSKKICPKAVTSTAGANDKSKCYLAGGSKICEESSGICYTFPSGTSIPWLND